MCNQNLKKLKLSVVVPAFNEEDNIQPLYSLLKNTLDNQVEIDEYEIIFVDDGSTDSTPKKINGIEDLVAKNITLNHNQGKTTALMMGIKETKYNVVATLDADLQNDPADIIQMLQKLDEGYDCVVGWRSERKDSLWKVFCSKVANAVRRFVLKDTFRDINCGLRVFKKECIKEIEMFEGAHRFFPYLIQKRGFKVTECEVRHHPRKFGQTKYTMRNRIIHASKDLWRVKKDDL